jgi:probable O-glycosylation ligase (exosortase A-associated)
VRALVLLVGVLGALALALAYPYAGVLLWSWFSLQQPHQEAYGFIQFLPLNLIIAVVTLGAWILSRERKTPPAGFIFWMLIVFLVWMTFNSFFAYDPAWSWPYWDRTWKSFVLGLMIAITAGTRVRLYALAWIIVISLFYYGVKGGIFTLLTGGHFHVFGPPSTIIGDNNQLALALLMAIPFANYLRGRIADRRIALVLVAGMALTVVSIIGSYSRGALIGLAALGLFMLVRGRNRVVYIALAGIVLFFAVNFMPEHFLHRADTIANAGQDESVQGRLFAWRVAFHYASDHFPFGAGFYGPQLPGIFHRYFPDETTHAAHSIYFQVLGEHGFIGLVLYLAILGASLWRCSKIISVTRGVPDQRWAHDLAMAIQASLFVFCVGGAALSMAYYDLFIIDVAMLLPLREVVLAPGKRKRAAWSPPPVAIPERV